MAIGYCLMCGKILVKYDYDGSYCSWTGDEFQIPVMDISSLPGERA